MQIIAIVIVLALLGCVEYEMFDINLYIRDNCNPDSDRVWYISADFIPGHMEMITEAVDEANSVFDTDISICGVVNGTGESEQRVFTRGKADEKKGYNGWYQYPAGGDITLWTDRMEGYMFYRVALHEIGHHIRGRKGHLEGDNLMVRGRIEVDYYTEEDIRFIKGGD